MEERYKYDVKYGTVYDTKEERLIIAAQDELQPKDKELICDALNLHNSTDDVDDKTGTLSASEVSRRCMTDAMEHEQILHNPTKEVAK